MISMLLIAIALLQRPGALQPGSGIVTGSVQLESGGAAAGVRVGAMSIDDASSLVSVTETDGAGNYRLINIPQGKYFIVAGRLDNLTYFPGGADRTKATEIAVEAAKITAIASFSVPAGSKRVVAPAFTSPSGDPGSAAYQQIVMERNRETRKKLLLNFEKNFPKSSRLGEVYIELSRLLVTQSDFRTANDYAEKAVVAVNRLKAETPANFDKTWHAWVASLDASARDNLAWVKQMVVWQQRQINAAILGRR